MLWRDTPTASASCCCVQPRPSRSSFTRLFTFGVMTSKLYREVWGDVKQACHRDLARLCAGFRGQRGSGRRLSDLPRAGDPRPHECLPERSGRVQRSLAEQLEDPEAEEL